MKKIVASDVVARVAERRCEHFHGAVELIGRRWNGVILRSLFGGEERFSAIRAQVPGITDAMLSQRLRELEEQGLVVREVSGSRPVEVAYRLTVIGRHLAPAFEALMQWSDEWGNSKN